MKKIFLLVTGLLGIIDLNFAQVPSTTCAGAPVLTINGACPSGAPLISMAAAYNTAPVLAATCGGAAVRVGYYQFTTGASPTTINVTASNANRNLAIQVFSGSCGAPVAVACANAFGAGASTESAVFSAAASTTYWIEILNVGTASMDLNSVCVTSSVMGTGAVYIGSNGGNPWGSTSNQTAMNTVFGGGGWVQQYYETLNPATTFSATNCFIFMEGGDFTTTAMQNFLTANIATIQNWVSIGGRLIINAAPNVGGNVNYGFGGVTLNYNGGTTLEWNGNASAGQAGHPIFNGPNMPCGTAFTGNYFAHAWISGGGTTALIEDAPGPSLTEKVWGAGRVLFGGMTTSNWHLPAPNSDNLIANIVKYQQSCITPLPVEMVTFTGECSHEGSIIKWSTASEINNAEFIIQSSVDGITYAEEAKVSGAGYSNDLKEYSYKSPLRSAPGNYFRLIQKDFDGTEKIYSPIYISCDGTTNNNCAVLNVANDQMELDIFSTQDEEITCTLLDVRGASIKTVKIQTIKGMNTVKMDIHGLASGVYMVMVSGSDHQCASKFLKH